jgi:hypothetical protein
LPIALKGFQQHTADAAQAWKTQKTRATLPWSWEVDMSKKRKKAKAAKKGAKKSKRRHHPGVAPPPKRKPR